MRPLLLVFAVSVAPIGSTYNPIEACYAEKLFDITRSIVVSQFETVERDLVLWFGELPSGYANSQVFEARQILEGPFVDEFVKSTG